MNGYHYTTVTPSLHYVQAFPSGRHQVRSGLQERPRLLERLRHCLRRPPPFPSLHARPQSIALCMITSFLGSLYFIFVSTLLHETGARPILFQVLAVILFTIGWIMNAVRNVQKDDLPWIENLISMNRERLLNIGTHTTVATSLLSSPVDDVRRDALSLYTTLTKCHATVKKCLNNDERRLELILIRYQRRIDMVSYMEREELEIDPLVRNLLTAKLLESC